MTIKRTAASVPAEPYLRKDLQDSEFAAAFLNAAAADAYPDVFMLALREVVEAYGGIGAVARRAKLNRQQLYRTLANGGNPEFRTLRAILEAAGFSLAVVPHARTGKRAAKRSGRRKNLVLARHAAQIEAS